MDPYLLVVKYIFDKNKKGNVESNFRDFFLNGSSFPEFIAILFGIEKIPGIVQPKSIFQKSSNNNLALSYLSQNNPFFQSYQVDFNNEKNQKSLIQLILNKVYFKTNIISLLKKCNDLLLPHGLNISNFSEFIQGIGFMKLLNVVSKGSILPEVNHTNKDQLINEIIQNINSLNIPVIIDKTSFEPTNQDLLIFQALIIMEHNKNILDIKRSNEFIDNTNLLEQRNNEKLSSDLSLYNDNKAIESDITKTIDFKKIENNTNSNNTNKDYDDESDISNFINNNDSKNTSIKLENTAKNTENNLDNKSSKTVLNTKSTNQYNDNHTNKSSEKYDNIDLKETKDSFEISSSSKLIESSDIINKQKSSYINIVNNIVETNNKKGIVFFSDFEQGQILPDLIEILMKTKVPNIIDNPKGYDQLMNNMSVLYFINHQDPEFNPRNYIMSKENDIIDLIRYLLKKIIFTEEFVNQMNEECNKILYLFNLKASNFNVDWSDGTKFVALLSFLSNREISFQSIENLDIIKLKDLFSRANCVSIIEKDAIFEKIDECAILYQIKIILDEVKKRNLVIPKEGDMKVSQDNKENEQKEETIIKEEYVYIKDSNPIIRLFNLIGKKIGVHYDSLDDIINENTLHLLVQYLMKVPQIPRIETDQNLAKNNVKTVLNFLSEKNIVFRFTSFNFSDEANKNENIIYFATTLLQEYFIKGKKSKLVNKVSECFGEVILLKDFKHIFSFGNGFYKILGYKDIKENNYYNGELLLECFQKANIPYILDDASLASGNEDYICYQLELIYDKPFDENEENNEIIEEQKEYAPQLSPEEEMIHNFMNKLNKKKTAANQKDEPDYLSPLSTIIEGNKLNDLISNLTLDSQENTIKAQQQKRIFETNTNSQFQNSIDKLIKNLKPLVKNQKIKNLEEKSYINIIKNYQFIKNIENKELIINNSDNPDFPLTYNLYSYKIANLPSDINDQIDKKVLHLFEETIAGFGNKVSDDFKSTQKYKHNDAPLKTYRLFEYKSNSWIYNKNNWIEFKNANNLKTNDVLYLILMSPKCRKVLNIEDDEIYNFLKTITASKKIEAIITNEIYVEIIFGGKIKDIQEKFGINSIKSKNENIAFIQICYPPLFKNNPIIQKMQAFLTLHADHILSIYPSTSIDESLSFINTSFYHSIQSNLFNSKHVSMSFLFTSLLSDAKINVDLIKNPSFELGLDKKLNSDKEILKLIKNKYEFVMTTFHWIDINNYESYNHFLETMINKCQKNINVQNQIGCKLSNDKDDDFFDYYYEKVFDINSIHDQKEMNNFMYKFSKYLEQKMFRNIKPLFKCRNNYDIHNTFDEKIFFDQEVWDKLINENNVDIEKDSVISILFINSNPKDVNMVARTLSQTAINYSSFSYHFQADIYYCGKFENAASSFDVKKSSEFNKSHLIFINIILPPVTRDEYTLFFETSIASKCNLIITIPRKETFSYQFSISRKLVNVINWQFDEKVKIDHKYIWLFNNYLSTNYDIQFNKSIQSEDLKDEIYYQIDLTNKKSISGLIELIIKTLPNCETKIKIIHDYFTNINTKNKNIFYIDIIQIMNKVTKYDEVYYEMYDDDVMKMLEMTSIYLLSHYNNTPNLFSFANNYFIDILYQIRKDKIASERINSIRYDVCSHFIELASKDCINKILETDFKFDEFTEPVKNYIIDSVTEIDAEFVKILKKSCHNKIEDAIFIDIIKKCSQFNISHENALFINKIIFKKLSNKIANSINEIDSCYEDIVRNDSKEILMDKEEIQQSSMKYILTTKESINENTIQLTKENIESEIPQDF